ncbi:MAG: aldehyde dehydrogenase family protein, partial [Deltaproteobacteria bacterium]|nr:aldehyde dehydrogenase family protein [Deltaproteobacteria bacterium]
MRRHKLWLDGKWLEGTDHEVREIRSPFDGEVVARADYASADQMERAIAASVAAFTHYRRSSRFARARLLEAMRDGIAARKADLARVIALEAGKPITIAEGEVLRALTTFTVAAEEAKRVGGDVIPIDIDATGRPYSEAVSYWVPRGPILGITPFNFPVN